VKPLRLVALQQKVWMQPQMMQLVLQVEPMLQHLRDEFFRRFLFLLPEQDLHQALMQAFEPGE
jgi:hypothetical protein